MRVVRVNYRGTGMLDWRRAAARVDVIEHRQLGGDRCVRRWLTAGP